MPASRQPRKVITLRLRADVVDALRQLVRDQAGKPLYLTLGGFCEDAILRHIAYTERRLESSISDATRGGNSRLTKS